MTLKTNLLFKLIIFNLIIYFNPVISANHQNVLQTSKVPESLTSMERSNNKQQVNNYTHEITKITTNKDLLLNGSTIQQSSYIKASNSDADDLFGRAIDISGNTMVVGASFEDSGAIGVNGDETDSSAENSGAAYVYVKENGTWVKQAYLKASNTEAGDRFGGSVAIYGDTIVVGAQFESGLSLAGYTEQTNNLNLYSGAVYVFVREGNTWSQQAYLKASISGRNTSSDSFGNAVDIYDDTIVVGAYREGSASTGINGNQLDNSKIFAGAAYVFVREQGQWNQHAYLKPHQVSSFDEFGSAVAIYEDNIVISAIHENSGTIGVNNTSTLTSPSSGAAYIFERTDGIWRQDSYIKASNTGDNDTFGSDVDISKNIVVIGAVGEDGNAAGINGDEFNDLEENSGAVYVFTKNNVSWSQQTYIKASNVGRLDRFGSSVSISGDTLAIGAIYERSSAKGLNGDESNNLLINSGAAYIFENNGESWQQKSYIKASNPDENDSFGAPLALDGNNLIISSQWEDSEANGIDGNELDNSKKDSGALYTFNVVQAQFSLQAGHSALWYNHNQNGHGINVYMLEDNRIIVIWYVYDNAGKPIWLLGVGTHDGITATLDVSITDGAMFPPDFDANNVNTVSWGQFELEFSSCNAGLFKWIPLADNGFTAGEMNVARLNNTSGLNCSDTNIKAKELPIIKVPELKAGDFVMQDALSALWYDPNQNGQGINVYMLAESRIIVIWYVYDDTGHQMWLLGVGSHDGIKATLDVSITDGAMFPPNFNSDDVNLTSWGQFELEFSGCNAGLFKWMPEAGNGYTAGEMNIIRLNNTLGLSCIE